MYQYYSPSDKKRTLDHSRIDLSNVTFWSWVLRSCEKSAKGLALTRSPDSRQISPWLVLNLPAGGKTRFDAFNEGTVIFVFARRYFVSFKSCPLLFLLLAEVVFIFCEVIAKLILATCVWAWASTHDVEKVISVNLLKFLYLCSTNNLGSDSTVLASLLKPKLIKDQWKRTPRTTCRERPETFFLVNVSSTLCVDCVNHSVIMKTEIRPARALAWCLLGLVTQHCE